MDIQPVSGLWVHGGQEYHDELIRFVVDAEVSPSTEAFFAEFKTTLKIRFQQIDIWITAYPIRLL